jgi:hypothetical protein
LRMGAEKRVSPKNAINSAPRARSIPGFIKR